MNKDILNKLFPDMVEKIEKGLCPTCGGAIKIEDFTDPTSVKEFRISGMCARCQQKTFGEEDEDDLSLSDCCGAISLQARA